MPESFKVGDVVELKSGGPRMTIAEPNGSGDGYNCIWFDKDLVPQARIFKTGVLNLAEPKSKSRVL